MFAVIGRLYKCIKLCQLADMIQVYSSLSHNTQGEIHHEHVVHYPSGLKI